MDSVTEKVSTTNMSPNKDYQDDGIPQPQRRSTRFVNSTSATEASVRQHDYKISKFSEKSGVRAHTVLRIESAEVLSSDDDNEESEVNDDVEKEDSDEEYLGCCDGLGVGNSKKDRDHWVTLEDRRAAARATEKDSSNLDFSENPSMYSNRYRAAPP
jgi:hypothetical protein